jgi:hypothetical protein
MGVVNTRKKRTICQTLTLGCLLSLSVSSAAQGEIVVDQPPNQTNGQASDTEFIASGSGSATWQLIADDFMLAAPAVARHISFWGFFGGNFDEFPEPAPLSETLRVRIYGARTVDGLPDSRNVLIEEVFSNPLRTPTGLTVALGPLPPEYQYDLDFTVPLFLSANETYWIELAQLGDINSHFRWERGTGPISDFAFQNPNVTDWGNLPGNFAFRISTVPEPASIYLLILGALITRWGRGGRRGEHV